MKKRDSLLTGDKITLMLSVIPYLLEHGATPVPVLARAFDVDAETMRSLIRFLGVAGVPGETATYQHEDLFDIDWDALDDRDEAVLVRTVVVAEPPRFSPREVAALLAGLQYLRGLPGVTNEEQVDALTHKLIGTSVQPVSTLGMMQDEIPEGIDTLRTALAEKRAVTFTYRNADGIESRRLVVPEHVEPIDGSWYLNAWCSDRRSHRLFRVDRMNALELTEPPVDAPSPDTSRYDETLFHPADDAIRVSLLLHEGNRGALRRFDPEDSNDETTVLLARAERAPMLASAAPGAVEVLSPPAARRAVRDWATRALAQYDA